MPGFVLWEVLWPKPPPGPSAAELLPSPQLAPARSRRMCLMHTRMFWAWPRISQAVKTQDESSSAAAAAAQGGGEPGAGGARTWAGSWAGLCLHHPRDGQSCLWLLTTAPSPAGFVYLNYCVWGSFSPAFLSPSPPGSSCRLRRVEVPGQPLRKRRN